ncbi:uncharacterized protein LOC128546110 [Mercenaria mercenaria]|uniref:uncharacterized protein LOC128546110 n=1 Tax=Mercenaria mercenaria TaxID=6596 RepID=UPI00234F710F|nr:uncharacterized protein LOC128546110 [Mercenaria mercenaria]
MAAKQALTQGTESTANTDENVPPCEDLKSVGNIQISDAEWKELCKTAAVQSCLFVFGDEASVLKAMAVIKTNKGHFPADTKGYDIAVIIIDMEDDDLNTGWDSAIVETENKGDGILHKLPV